MKKTINVNLNGRVFTMDEDAYQLLDNYLSNLRIYFRKEEGSAEIIADFEARIEELFSEKIRLGYQVINISQVEEVIARVGKPADFSEEDAREEEKQTANQDAKEAKKKFFRDSDDKIIGGVCSGISSYFGWAVLPVRIVFIILILATSLWIIPAYLLAWILFPEARTAEQKLQMRGKPITVENIGKTVASEMEKPKEKEKSGCVGGFIEFVGGFLKVCFIGLGCLIGIPMLFGIVLTVIILFAVLFGVGGGIAGMLPWGLYGDGAFLLVSNPVLATAAFIVILLIPFLALIYGIVAYFVKLKPLNKSIKWVGFLLWILALILFFCSGFRINREYIGNIHHRHWHDAIEGNGVLAEKEYALPLIDYISMEEDLIAHLQIEQIPGDSVFLLISGDENLIDRVQHRISDGKLRLSTVGKQRFKRGNKLIIRVQTPSLKKIKSESVGNISINQSFVSNELDIELDGVGKFQADSLAIQILRVDSEGIGSVSLAGYARNATLKAEGVGGIDAWDLSADTIFARVDGIASIRCNPREYLKGRVNGVGSIKYKDEPEKFKDAWVVGVGKIEKEK
jgi:phage shock protein PspC (stress-responsive transcriptional regulator)